MTVMLSVIQSNLSSLNTNGSFTMASSNQFTNPYEILPTDQENKYLGVFSYFIINLYKIEKVSLNYRHLLPDPAPWLTLSGSNYLYLEQISMVPKIFEPLKFDCSKLTWNCKTLSVAPLECMRFPAVVVNLDWSWRDLDVIRVTKCTQKVSQLSRFYIKMNSEIDGVLTNVL